MTSVIFVGIILIIFFLCLYTFVGSRYFYHAQLLYHYLFDREVYKHFKSALLQIKQNGPLSFLPLSYWINSEIQKNYNAVGKYALTYHLVDINSHPILFLGSEGVITNFSNLLIKKLIKESNISDKNVQLLNLIEHRVDELGYPNFMTKYFGSDCHKKNITYKEFLTTFVEKDEHYKLIKKGA